MAEKVDRTLKILLIGSAAVGKTSLVNQFVHGKFRKDYVLTIGMEPYTKYEDIADLRICYTIFDIAGQQQFSRLRKMFYKGSKGALAVFDLTRKDTFDEIREWIADARQVEPDQQFILIGNKADLTDDRAVKQADAETQAKELDCIEYLETSAKTGTQVDDAFNTLGNHIITN